MRPRPRADLISQVTKGSGTYTYEYDDKHQVIQASNDGVSMYAGYDSRGNTTGTMLTGTGTDLRIASAAGYDSTGNRAKALRFAVDNPSKPCIITVVI